MIAGMDSLILNTTQIRQKIRRMAYEIYERNIDQTSIGIVGIQGMGYDLAVALSHELGSISGISVTLCRLNIDKLAAQPPLPALDHPPIAISGTIILVDDVLNSGKTLYHSLRAFVEWPIQKLQVAVLVDRSHRHFPVSPDYVGYELSTTVNQHITVDIEKGVWLK